MTQKKELKKQAERRSARRRAHRAPKETPRWQTIENVVAAIKKTHMLSVPGLKVTQKAMVEHRDPARQPVEVDVLVEFDAGDEHIALGLDVKDEQRPLDVNKVAGLCKTRKALKLDKFYIVSRSGFSREAVLEAASEGVVLLTIREIERAEWFNAEAITMNRQTFDVFHTDLQYAGAPETPPSLAGRVNLDTLYVDTYHETKLTLRYVLNAYCLMYVTMCPPPAMVPDAFYITLTKIVMDTWRRFYSDDIEHPIPTGVRVEARFAVTHELVPIRAFRTSDGSESVSGEVEFNGQRLQLNVIKDPGDDESVHWAIGPAIPSRHSSAMDITKVKLTDQ